MGLRAERRAPALVPLNPAMRFQVFLLGLAFTLGLTILAQARQVNWRGLSNRAHETSSGAAWDATFVLEVGAFASGFTPTPANTADWHTHWHAADRTVFRPSDRLFVSSHVVASSNSATPLGQQAYIWGYSARAQSSEWILLTSESWIWPAASNLAFPLTWVVTPDRAEAILGTLSDAEGTPYLTSAPVDAPLPVLLPSQWQATQFTPEDLNDASISAWLADPDGDGLTNQMEFALGTDPWSPLAGPSPFSLSWIDEERLELRLTRLPERLVLIEMQYATHYHENWIRFGDSGAEGFTRNSLVAQVLEDFVQPLEKQFYRLQASWIVPPP